MTKETAENKVNRKRLKKKAECGTEELQWNLNTPGIKHENQMLNHKTGTQKSNELCEVTNL